MTHSATLVRMLSLLCLAAPQWACATRAGPGEIQPGVEAAALTETAVRSPRMLVFDWRLQDGQARFSGSGAARMAPAPPRVRLDLFGPQDEGYLSAVLRDGQLFVPTGVPAELIPPAPLLWAALGVIRPPDGARLLSAVREGNGSTLVYGADDGDWRYVVRDGRLRSAEWSSARGARHTVAIEPGEGAPRRSVYRDWQQYRELTLELEREEPVQGFPSDTWSLDAAR